MDKGGSVSVDFMVASLMIILIIPGLVAIVEERMDTAESVNEMASAKVLTENVAETVEMVYSGGEGCSIVYKMPPAVGDKPYRLSVNSSAVAIEFNGNMGSAYITNIKFTDLKRKYVSKCQMEADRTYNITNVLDEYGYTRVIINRVA